MLFLSDEIPVMDKSDIQLFVKDINKDILQYDQRLTFITHALLDKEFLVFSYTIASEISKFQMHYTEQAQVFFGIVTDAIGNSNTISISWIDANNLSSSVKGKPFTKNYGQQLIKQWINQGYFVENENENIYWGPRMIVEFGNYLKTQFPDVVQDCFLCSQIVLWVRVKSYFNNCLY